MSIPAENITTFEKVEDQSDASTQDDFYFSAFLGTYAKAKRILKSTLGYSVAVQGQGLDNDKQFLTPKGFGLSVANTGGKGIIEIATDAEAIEKETPETDKAIVASNVPPIFDAYFAVTGTYDQTNVDTGKTNVAVSQLEVDEVQVGKIVKQFCNAVIVVSGTIPYIEIGLNSNYLPTKPRNGAGTWFNTTESAYLPFGCRISVDSGKLLIHLASSDGSDFAAGNYTISFQYEFLIS